MSGDNQGPGYASRSSTERDSREKSQSQSEERTLPPGRIEVEDNSQLAQNVAQFDLDGFQIRPKFGERFSTVAVEQMMETTLKEFFHGDRKHYHADLAEDWVVEIGKILIAKIRSDFNYPRYKFVSHVAIGEKIGGGVHIGMKCLWDGDSDSYATYVYVYVGLFVLCGHNLRNILLLKYARVICMFKESLQS